jgi:hypothetical protein
MVSSSTSDWKSHYLHHTDIESINKQMEKVLAFCRYDLCEACLKNLKDNPGLAFLGVDIFNDLFLFHQVQVLGPNLAHPEEKFLALTEFGNPASCFRLHIKSLFHPVKVNVPKWTQLKTPTGLR